jgi:2-dehydro-3-deoxy-D-gluconate 5-dehydrogenase
MFDLKTKVAIVTGGNGGIGLGMARGLARAGATVVVAARDAGKSAEAVHELRSLGSEAFAVEVNVCDEAAVAALVAGTVERCGRLDILVNNAFSPRPCLRLAGGKPPRARPRSSSRGPR